MLIIVLTTLVRDVPIGGSSGTPLLPFPLQGLTREVFGLIVTLSEPPGAKIDASANGKNKDDDRGTLEDQSSYYSEALDARL